MSVDCKDTVQKSKGRESRRWKNRMSCAVEATGVASSEKSSLEATLESRQRCRRHNVRRKSVPLSCSGHVKGAVASGDAACRRDDESGRRRRP